MLAYDVLQWFFHYLIHLPTLNVQLVGMYSLAQSTSQNHVPDGTCGFVGTYCLGKQGKRGVWIERERGSMKRGVFVFEAGRQDGDMEVMDKDQPEETIVFDLYENEASGQVERIISIRPVNKFTDRKLRTHTATIDGWFIYEVGSYDLRDECFPQHLSLMFIDIIVFRAEDLTHCTLCEVSGRIVLENWGGEVMVL
jgi:hypothetical protein